jgi:hypothetical protein
MTQDQGNPKPSPRTWAEVFADPKFIRDVVLIVGVIAGLCSSQVNSCKTSDNTKLLAPVAAAAANSEVDTKRLVADRTDKPEDKAAVVEAEQRAEEVKAATQQIAK